ncbi:Lrp/AsnC family transcriptional regulator [Microbacterium sp. KR10-403]|uniref:Lrp/AsnC family transcriptional regulator n=1 Tax=Microbacterium sp. KR10-403 TaxID=3158581 RepID=UPI0032E3BE30
MNEPSSSSAAFTELRAVRDILGTAWETGPRKAGAARTVGAAPALKLQEGLARMGDESISTASFVSPTASLSTLVERTTPEAKLDDIDRMILEELRRDARVSQRQLGRSIGMSAPAVGERIARLERAGVIRGYSVDIDWGAVGMPILAYIPMTVTAGVDIQMILDGLRQVPELDGLTLVTGGYDLIARFRVRDHRHLQETLLDRLFSIPGLQRFETFLALGEIPAPDLLTTILAERDAPQATPEDAV